MTTVSAEIHINAPKKRVWEIVADLGAVSNFHPFVPKSYYDSVSKSDIGASRVCELNPNMALKETVLSWHDGESYVLEVEFVKGQKPPVNDLQARLSVKEINGGTLVTLQMSYQPRFGPIGWLIDQMMIKPQYKKMLPSIVDGLKHYAETKEVVDLNVLKRIKLQAVAMP